MILAGRQNHATINTRWRTTAKVVKAQLRFSVEGRKCAGSASETKKRRRPKRDGIMQEGPLLREQLLLGTLNKAANGLCYNAYASDAYNCEVHSQVLISSDTVPKGNLYGWHIHQRQRIKEIKRQEHPNTHISWYSIALKRASRSTEPGSVGGGMKEDYVCVRRDSRGH